MRRRQAHRPLETGSNATASVQAGHETEQLINGNLKRCWLEMLAGRAVLSLSLTFGKVAAK